MSSNSSAFKTITFKDELKKFINSELTDSRQLIFNKWDKKLFDKDSKEWFNNTIEQLLHCIEVLKLKI